MITSEEIKRRLWDGANELRGSMDAGHIPRFVALKKVRSNEMLLIQKQSGSFINK